MIDGKKERNKYRLRSRMVTRYAETGMAETTGMQIEAWRRRRQRVWILVYVPETLFRLIFQSKVWGKDDPDLVRNVSVSVSCESVSRVEI